MNSIQTQNRNQMITYTNYKDQLTEAMKMCNDVENSIFIGQQIVWKGNPMSTTLDYVDTEKMIEVPVMEETQMGMSLGLAMVGKLVITFYPRWDFLISATNQLVNHIDKYEFMTGITPHIIIRVGKGSERPLDPGHQHKGNYISEFSSMLKNIKVLDCKTIEDIQNNYEFAINNVGIYLINEYPAKYYE
jgi:pyruvate/2-oxoglutarate/acetoin dehydrogenase E1 component